MDPNACLNELLRALEDGDREDAIIACDNLGDWLQKEGFLPQVEYGGSPQRDGRRAWIVG